MVEQQVQLFKLLSHPARIAILDILRNGEECVCHMEATLGYRQAYLSQQLALLREAGIIQDRRVGWNIYYQIAQPQILSILDSVGQLTGGQPSKWTTRESNPDCPCPKCGAGK